MNLSHDTMNGRGVFRSPMPMTNLLDSRSRVASRVKSLSLEMMQNPSTLSLCRMSIASMIIAESVAFFPVV